MTLYAAYLSKCRVFPSSSCILQRDEDCFLQFELQSTMYDGQIQTLKLEIEVSFDCHIKNLFSFNSLKISGKD